IPNPAIIPNNRNGRRLPYFVLELSLVIPHNGMLIRPTVADKETIIEMKSSGR
ncbi:unnamed protein product, partial [marine sediment metagenome]